MRWAMQHGRVVSDFVQVWMALPGGVAAIATGAGAGGGVGAAGDADEDAVVAVAAGAGADDADAEEEAVGVREAAVVAAVAANIPLLFRPSHEQVVFDPMSTSHASKQFAGVGDGRQAKSCLNLQKKRPRTDAGAGAAAGADGAVPDAVNLAAGLGTEGGG